MATALLGAGLLQALPVAGAPRQTLKPQAMVSPAERLCAAHGVFAFNRATDRDNGVGLIQALASSRQWDAEHAVEPEIRKVHEGTIRGVYEYLTVSAAQMRQLLEAACMARVAPLEMTTPAPAKDETRY